MSTQRMDREALSPALARSRRAENGSGRRPRAPRWVAAALAVLLAACAASSSQQDAAAPAGSGAAAAELASAELRGREHFILELPRLAAHAEAFVQSRFFQKLAELSDKPDAASTARALFAMERRWVPESFSFRLGEDGVLFLDHMVRTGLYFGLSHGALASNDAASLAQLREPLLSELRRFALPELAMEVRFATAETASELFGMARAELAQQPPEAGRLTLSDTSIHYELAADELLEPNQAALAAVALQVTQADDRELMAAIEETARRQRLELDLTLSGTSISLELRAPGAKARAPSAPARSLLDASGDSTVFWMTAELGALRRAAAEWSAILERYEATPAFLTLAAADEEDVIGSLRSMAREIGKAGDRLTSVMRVTPAGLEIETRSVGNPSVAPLDGSPLLVLDSPEFALSAIHADESVGSLLAAQLERFENRMATSWLKEAVSGDGGENRWDLISKAYYTAFRDFRRSLLSEPERGFQRPAAVIFDLQGKLAWQPGVAQAKLAKAGTYPIPELALVGRVESAEVAKLKVEQIYEELAKGTLSLLGRERAKDSVSYEPLDVGARERAFRFGGKWLRELIPEKLGRIKGDLDPHYLITGSWLVISTSPRLTRKIAKELAAPAAPGTEKELVAIGHLETSSVVDYVVRLWERLDPKSEKKVRAQLNELGRMVPRMAGYTRDEGQVRVSRAEMRVTAP